MTHMGQIPSPHVRVVNPKCDPSKIDSQFVCDQRTTEPTVCIMWGIDESVDHPCWRSTLIN